ncbi:unnamed protein product [Hymenolepis diminuta]|uniref:Neur_chan_LBD domain-containing protein n=1 Tax=Hymenolepis diminuta TaxID=6216 RepID=A0A0R3SC46_HYMDI|nr:unnamed protein product [Hymenolepis diminuta]
MSTGKAFLRKEMKQLVSCAEQVATINANARTNQSDAGNWPIRVSVVIVCRSTLPFHACAKFFALAIWSGRIPAGIYAPIMKSSQSGLCPIVFLLLLFVQCALQDPPPKGHPKINKTKSVEKALIRMLIARYQKFGVVGRPVRDNKQVLLVRYGLQLIQILELDENKQILHTNCWSMHLGFSQYQAVSQKPAMAKVSSQIRLITTPNMDRSENSKESKNMSIL